MFSEDISPNFSLQQAGIIRILKENINRFSFGVLVNEDHSVVNVGSKFSGKSLARQALYSNRNKSCREKVFTCRKWA